MSNTTPSPNMNMPVPVTGVDPSPEWANDLNACLSIIDGHNHAIGTGNQINPDGIVINADLPFMDNNATTLRAARFTPQGSPLSTPADVGELYEVGVDLWYNDGAGNQIRITQGGTVTGATGTITGLPSGTASASYGAGTFTFQSATNTPATLDVGSVIIRDETVGGDGITLQAPVGLGSDYNITLPLLPASTSFVRIDSSGNMSTVNLYDYIVAPSGGDYSTISAAIAAASNGQSIFVAGGTYTENVTVNKALNIFGAGRGTLINGSLTFASGSSDSLVQSLKIAMGVTINTGVTEVQLVQFWNGTGFVVTDNGTGSYIQGMQE